MKRLTAFSFGYYGWGRSTEHLVAAVDAVERARGFKPPIFVDIRIRRSVRATGFNGQSFGNLVGPSRHHWIPRLGNKTILTGTGPRIRIADPSAAEDLLDLVVDAAGDNRRIIFFCSCLWPKWNRRVTCHRVRVATLLRLAAKRREVGLQTVAWPGGKPEHFDLTVSAEEYRSVEHGRFSIPVGIPRPLAEWAGIAWGSTVTLHADGQRLHRITGPVKWEKNEWALPIPYYFFDPTTSLSTYQNYAKVLRESAGLLPCKSD